MARVPKSCHRLLGGRVREGCFHMCDISDVASKLQHSLKPHHIVRETIIALASWARTRFYGTKFASYFHTKPSTKEYPRGSFHWLLIATAIIAKVACACGRQSPSRSVPISTYLSKLPLFYCTCWQMDISSTIRLQIGWVALTLTLCALHFKSSKTFRWKRGMAAHSFIPFS